MKRGVVKIGQLKDDRKFDSNTEDEYLQDSYLNRNQQKARIEMIL